MERKWTNVLVLLVFYHSEFGWTLTSSSVLSVVKQKACVAPFRSDLRGSSAAGTSEGRRVGGHRVSTHWQQ